MSIAPHTILRPFVVNPVCRYFGRHARFGLRPCSVEAVNGGKELESGKRRRRKKAVESRLEVLYDDGFGSVAMKDYLKAVKAMAKDDGGPPRWFSPMECGRPEVDMAPLLLFLPGIDGVGIELILHHKSLGKVFEVRCFHIPVNDRTPFEGKSIQWEVFFPLPCQPAKCYLETVRFTEMHIHEEEAFRYAPIK